MNGSRLQGALMVFLALALSAGGVAQVAAQAGDPPAAPAVQNLGAAFTYQGQLSSGGTPVNGTCDMQFSLYDALSGPAQVGATQNVASVSLSGGKFTVPLNAGNEFGSSAFDGNARWLQIAVRCPAGSGGYVSLSPRQPLTGAPYALGLKPGTVVRNSSPTALGAGLKVSNPYTGEDGLSGVVGAESNELTGTSSGVRGDSHSELGVLGVSDLSYGVYGLSDGYYGLGGETADTTGAYAGVVAASPTNNGKDISLMIAYGGIRVYNAGVNTDTPVFIHKVDTTPGTGNICGNGAFPASTVIDYPLINGDPNAILIVTPNYGIRTDNTPPANAIPAVYYDGDDHCGPTNGRWVITNIGPGVAQPNNAKYNVLVVVP